MSPNTRGGKTPNTRGGKKKNTPRETPNTPEKTPKKNTPTPTSPQNSASPSSSGTLRPSSLSMVSEAISKLEEHLNTFEQEDEGVDDTPIVQALKLFTVAVKEVSKHLYSEEKKKVVIKKELDDEKDEQRQAHLRGKFMISSPPRGDDLVGNAEKYKDDKSGDKIVQDVIKLAKDKYKVEIPEREISTCYALKNGGIVLGLWHLGRGSAFQRLGSAIRSNKDVDKEKNVYFNYMLTQKRNTLLFTVRKIKRTEDGKIQKFFTDEYGNITIVSKDGEKERITYTLETMKTLSVEELEAKYK